MGPAVPTTIVGEDVDVGPPRRCCRQVHQRPPLLLEKTSMVGPLGGAATRSGSAHHHLADVCWGRLCLYVSSCMGGHR
jgi:hypothetical protein